MRRDLAEPAGAVVIGAGTVVSVIAGYVPVLIAAFLFTMMVVWKIGRTLLSEYYADLSPPWGKS